MIKLAQTAEQPSDRRIYAREPVNEQVRLVGQDGRAFDGDVVDRSLRGLRLRVTEAATMPGEVYVLSRSRQAIYTARVVWRTPPHVGMAIAETTDMRLLPSPGTGKLHKLWREHVHR